MENTPVYEWSEIRLRLAPMNLRAVAKSAGVHESTLYRLLADGDKAEASMETRARLTAFLLKHAAGELVVKVATDG